MPLQVECMLLLSNGDIAISGGAFRFEICIYRHDLDNTAMGSTGGQREQLKLVDSIDTNGMNVVQMLELNDEYLLLIGHLSNMQIHRRLPPEKLVEEEKSGFNPSVNFEGLLSKNTRNSRPFQP